jgi:N-acetylglucosamine-6-sulfatase
VRRELAVAFGCVVMLVAGRVAVPAQLCPGDCDRDSRVSIDELILAVRVAQGSDADCGAADVDGDGVVRIDELVRAVRASLMGCAPAPTATLPATAAPTMTGSPSPNATPPPNIILIELDDVRADGIDRMPVVQSRLIGQGVSFRNSFVPLSLCCPSRASILGGLYALRHGTHHIDGEFGGAPAFRRSGGDHETIAVWLQNAGYATGLFGKYLNTYGAEHDQGPGGGFYIPPGWSRWRVFVEEHYGGRDGPTYELVDESGRRTRYDDHTSDQDYSTDVLAREQREFVADAVAAGQPFFAVWTPYTSHIDTPSLVPIPAARHRDTFADLPPARPPSFAEPDRSDKPSWVQALTPSPLSIGATHQARRRAYEALLSVDEQIGLMLEQLEGLGVDQDTIILLTSDNGVTWGEHALMWQSKECPYEECLRVPLVVRYPRGVTGVPRSADTPVLNIDVPATVADLAGVVVPVAIDGTSFRPALAGATRWLRDDFLLEHWSRIRDGLLSVPTSPPLDGDRLRLWYGPWPKQSRAFEFDDDGMVSTDAVAVPIETTGKASFDMLGRTVTDLVPNTAWATNDAWLRILDTSPRADGISWFEEVDQGSRFEVYGQSPDFFGVRDVANGFTYVEYGTGEVELYDLRTDPWQLDNQASTLLYGNVRAQLHARLHELLGLP